LGVRGRTALRSQPGGSAGRTAVGVALARAAGLVTGSAQRTLLPTTGYARWLAEPTAERWAQLVVAWLDLPRWPRRGLDPGGHVLGTDASWAVAPDLRRAAIEQLRAAPVTAVVPPERRPAVLGWP